MRLKGLLPLLGILMTVSFLSCSDDTDDNKQTGDKVQAIIQTGITTKAYDATWEINDAIGIAMMNPAQTEFIDDIYNYQYYTPSATANFVPSSDNEILYFPIDGSEVYFKGYYPYKADLTQEMTIPVTLEDQSDLPAIDVMTTEHLSGFSKADPNVHLRMHHRLSKVIFKYRVSPELEDMPMNGSTVTIHGTKTTGTLDILKDTVFVDDDSVADILLPDRGVDTDRNGIVMPRPAGEGVTFDFNFTDGSYFTAAMSDTLELKPGYKYTFYISFEKTGVTFWVDIKDWIDTEPMFYEIVNAVFPMEHSEGVEPGDTMRVFMEGTDGTFSFLDKFTYGADDKWQSDKSITWEDIMTESGTFRASTVFDTPANDTQLADILVSDEVTVDRYHGVGLTFMHAGSRIVVNMNSDTFTEDELNSAVIELPQYLTGGYEENGAFVPGSVAKDVLVDRTDPKDQYAIVQPQTIPSTQSLVRITINNIAYSVNWDTDFTFEKGYAYLLNVTLNKTAIDVGVKIIDWIKGATLDLELKAIEVAGTLGENDSFFQNKSIMVYKSGLTLESVKYSLLEDGGQYRWMGKVLYWDDNMTQLPLVLTGLYTANEALYPKNLSLASPTFPWNLPANQSTGYADYDLLMDTVQIPRPVMVNFEFQHVLAKVEIDLVSDEFTTAELAGAQIQIDNIILDGRVSISSGLASGSGTPTSVIPYEEPKDAGVTAQKYTALVMPQRIAQNTSVISIRLKDYPNEVFTGSIQNSLNLEAGKIAVITLKLTKTEIELEATLKDWEPGDTGEVVIQ